MIGDEIPDCYVTWREKSGMGYNLRKLGSVSVRHTSRNTVEWTRPISGEVVRRRLTGKHTDIVSSDGKDVIALWSPPTPPPSARKQSAEFDARERYAADKQSADVGHDDYDETLTHHFHNMVQAGFEHKLECFGIADGIRRLPIDAAHAHQPAYLIWHGKGLALPEEHCDDFDNA